MRKKIKTAKHINRSQEVTQLPSHKPIKKEKRKRRPSTWGFKGF